MSKPSDRPFENRHTIVFALIVVLLFALLDLWGYGLKSLWDHHQQIAEKTENLEKELDVAQSVERTTKRLADWRMRSISSDTSVAISVYQRALLGIANELRVGDMTVEPATPKGFPAIGHRVTCTAKASMTALQFAQFVDRASQLDALHRITRLEILGGAGYGSSGRKMTADTRKRVVLTAELIAMSGAPGIAQLTTIKDAKDSTDSFAKIVADRKLFTRFTPPPPPEPAIAEASTPPVRTEPSPTKPVAIVKPPEPNRLERLQYVGSFSSHGSWQAWLYDTKSKEQYAVAERDVLRSGRHAIRIISIEADYLEFEADDGSSIDVERVELGKLLL